ncbi:golgin subfamily A member 6-like protein 22 [Hippoglossus stenolepis]|uniref:golgin subfamily A member 6-like protein 22 n=1 Tax=Hippoglossus stenolepis TaxID=195615 RepID=UPI001FB00DEB|nr:golgin subfamily A member 6-like protein 22 [Hippoglossus stenolepis]
MERINCSGDKSLEQMLSEGTQAFSRAARRVLRATGRAARVLRATGRAAQRVLRGALHRARRFAPTSIARVEKLEKDIKDLKMTMKVIVEEKFSLSSDLQLQPPENMIVESDWKVKFEALQDQLTETEEKLFAEQEKVKYLTQQNTELQELTLKTDENKEKKQETKEREGTEEEKEQGEEGKRWDREQDQPSPRPDSPPPPAPCNTPSSSA